MLHPSKTGHTLDLAGTYFKVSLPKKYGNCIQMTKEKYFFIREQRGGQMEKVALTDIHYQV